MVINLGTLSTTQTQQLWSFYGWGTYTPTTYTTSAPVATTTAPLVIATPPSPVPADQISIVTGIDPNEVAAATYNKIIPIWVGGMPRLGCHIIYGPTFATSGGITYASFGVSFGMPAVNLTITRELRELRLDGYKVWSLAEGYLMTGLTFRFYPGSELQAADPLVIAAYPSAPVAHRGHCCVFIENLALTDFNLKVPFVSAVIADPEAWTVDEDGAITTETIDPEDGIGLGYALEALAYSPYINLASANAYSYGHRATADFITEGISERIDALIVAENVSFLDLINRFARLHLWDIVQRDKLMAIERGSVAPDISLDLTEIVAAGDAPPILIERSAPSDRPRELEYSFIDIQRDYEINSVTAKQMSIPAPATVSEGKDTIALPVVHTTQEGMSWATLRNFKDALARETISFTTSIVGYEIEPGDIVSVDAGFKTYVIRVIESMKGANWTNRIRGEPVLRCAPPFQQDPFFDLVVFLLGPIAVQEEVITTTVTWDSATATAVTLSGGNLIVTNTGTSSGDQGAHVAASAAKSTGKYYIEIQPSIGGTGDQHGCGIGTPASNYSNIGSSATTGVMVFYGFGTVKSNGTNLATLGAVSAGHKIGIAIDFDNLKIWFRNVSNSLIWNNNGAANPATNVGGLTIPSGAMVPFVTFGGFLGTSGQQAIANFGASSFTITVPSGFTSGWPASAILTDVFIDEGSNPRTLTTHGDAQVDTSIFKFEQSALFDGTGDWISAADSADWQLAADNNDPYTVEAFIRINPGGSGTIAAIRPAAGSPTSWVFFVNGSGNVVWASSSISSAGSTFDCIVTSSVTIAADTWCFAAVDHDATGKVRMYVGTSGIVPMVGSQTPADSSIYPSGDLLGIGARGAGGGVDPFNGRIEELRITKGIARYASDAGAQIPSERFPRN